MIAMPVKQSVSKISAVPKPKSVRITVSFKISEREYAALEAMANQYDQSKTDFVRSWLRSLPTYQPAPVKPQKSAK
jgi:homogentisate 1,2-dioxygenase